MVRREVLADKEVKMARLIIEPGRCVDGYECPVCGNDEIELGQLYCQICGEPLEWREECDSEA